jgi:FG-GAP-like repeat
MLRKMMHVWIFLTLAATASAQTQSLFFQPPMLPASSAFSSGAAVVDLNGDGKLDVAYPDGTVWLSKADGTYQAGTPWCTKNQPYCAGSAVLTADFNSDGKADLVVATSNFVWVLLGNGDGTFQAAVSTVSGTTATTVFVADANGDGKPDVIFGAGTGSTATTCLGKGDGTFQTPITGPNLSGLQLLGVADVNGDHKVDLVATNLSASPQVSVFTGNGDGTFANTATVTNPGFPQNTNSNFDFQLADMNGDGKLDVVVSQFPTASDAYDPFDPTTTAQATFVALGKGDGTFANATQISSRGGLISVGDLNGDSVPDLVLVGPGVDVLLGTGGGNVTLKDSYFATLVSARPIIADFNGDGKADVFSWGALLLGNGDGTLKANPVSYAATIAPPAVVADFNGDGKADLAVFGVNASTVDILNGDGTGRFTAGFVSPVISSTQGVVSLETADLNGDGKPDLLIVTSSDVTMSGWTAYLLTGNGDGTFNAPLAVAQSSQLFAISAQLVDVNNDHKLDLIVSDSSGAINVFLGNGDGTFTALGGFFEGVTMGGLTHGVAFVAGDFNGDGNADLIVAAENGLNFLAGKGDGTFKAAVPSTPLISAVTAVGDFNGDGFLDLCGANVVLLGNGDGTFKAGSTIANSVAPVSYYVAIDLNGDGKIDLVGSASGSTHGAPGAIQYALGNGDGTFTPVILQQASSGVFYGAIVGDVNGDGRPDILFVNNNSIISMLNTLPPATADFIATAGSPSTSTVTAGQTATFGFNVTPTGGFAQTVSFTCSGAPANSTCTVSPTSAMVSGSTTVPIKVTVATTAGSLVLPTLLQTSPKGPQWPGAPVVVVMALLAILFVMAAGMAGSKREFGPARFRWATVGCGLTLAAASLLLTSCGGGSMQTSSQTNSGTATGNYTIKVTGAAGSGSSAVSHSVTFTLTVQ